MDQNNALRSFKERSAMRSNGYERKIEYFWTNFSRKGSSTKKRKRNCPNKEKSVCWCATFAIDNQIAGWPFNVGTCSAAHV
jgi:hypothetical protein